MRFVKVFVTPYPSLLFIVKYEKLNEVYSTTSSLSWENLR
ncbi:hypothetical protein SLEP1_g40337 [Rubroshorea leprosula]|uniref:Uncharacterized protein n=1 Tax=Rubroshorea leprosula TaxID=152421 RepID=A0AAV5L3D3_9ROSI|nr:hypothetical protein SLEP1_g40337 [Rubroshorea leprosula]